MNCLHRNPSSLRASLLLASLLLAGCLKAAAPETSVANRFPVDDRPLDRQPQVVTSYADILEPARNAVVSVTTARIVETMQRRGLNPMEEFLRRFYGMPSPDSGPGGGEPQERRIPSGMGSGVIISADGYILTNNHVITDDRGQPVDEITVNLADGTELKAELIGRDERTDVALLKVERDNLPFIPMGDSQKLRVGDVVFAIGNPLGLGLTTTMGIVSATGRSNLGILGNQGYEYFIQTDAAINRGNSGGALIDAMGRLVGINTAIYSQSGGNIGIGFAVPTRIARNVALDLIEHGTVRRGFLGVTIRDLNSNLAEAFGLADTQGVLVESVGDSSPAARAGIQRGDIIVSIDGTPIDTVATLRLTVAAIRPGTDALFVIVREGDQRTVSVTIGNQDDPAAVATTESPLQGVEIVPVTPALSQEFNLREERGLVVIAVDARSPYASSLTRGMVILEVNDKPVDSLDDLRSHLVRGRVNKLWISFRGNRSFFGLRVR
jgi:serine protease Do